MIRLFRQDWESRQGPLIKLAVIGAILFLSAMFGSRPSFELALLLAFGLILVVASIVLIRQLELGLFLLIPVSLSVKIILNTGTAVPLNLTLVLCGWLIAIWVLRMFVQDREVRLFPSRTAAPALAFALATSLSLIAGNVRWIEKAAEGASMAAQFGAWMLYVLPMGIFLLVGNQIRDIRLLRKLTWLFLAWGGVYIATRLFGIVALRDGLFNTIRSLGSIFWIYLAAMAFGQFFFNHELRLRFRIGLGLLVLGTFYVAVVQSWGWMSGWLPPMAAVATMIWLRSTRWRILLVCALLGFAFMNSSVIYDWFFSTTEHYTVVSRQATYPIMFELIRANPILGLGPANYYHYTTLFPILGWYVKFNSHSNYVDIVAQTGLLGMGIFVWLVIEIGLLGLRLLKQVQDGFSRGYIYGALGGLAAMLGAGFMGDWFLPFVYNVGFAGFRSSIFAWLFLGGLVAIEQINANQPEANKGDEAVV